MDLALLDRTEAFNAVFGASRGCGFASRGADAIWRSRGDDQEEWAAYQRLLRDVKLSARGRDRAIAALNGGAHVLASDDWESHTRAGWLLKDITNTFALDVIAFNRAETETLLTDLGLDECSTGVALARTITSVATAVRKTLDEPARALVAEGELDAQWILEAAAAAYEGALIKTIGRMAYTRRLMLAVVHGIGAPSLGRCEAAVAAWSTGTRRSRRAAALSALAG